MRQRWEYDRSESIPVNIWSAFMYTVVNVGISSCDEINNQSITWEDIRKFCNVYALNKK